MKWRYVSESILQRPGFRAVGLLVLLAAGVGCRLRPQSGDPAARRLALLDSGTSRQRKTAKIAAALTDPDPLVRRAAVQCLGGEGKAGLAGLTRALENDDFQVRRNAALILGGFGLDAVAPLARAVKDNHPLVRQAAVLALACLEPSSAKIHELIKAAGQDEDPAVKRAAIIAADQCLTVTAEIKLPSDGWKFKLDPERLGNDSGWFKPDLDDSKWDDIKIEKAWGHFGYKYIGTAWYRRSVTLPPKPEGNTVYLRFGGVDECAWVWVNGEYAGEHDIGPSGWDTPFRLEVTRLLNWGQENQITVRAMNTACAGGIWRPVTIVVTNFAK